MSDEQDSEDSGTILSPTPSTNTVWSKGDVCLAPWSGDSSPYKAVIKKLNRSQNGQFYATVKFCDYNSDDNEELPVSSLQKILQPKTVKCMKSRDTDDNVNLNSSLFKPLTGKEDDKRLLYKFENADPSEEHLERLLHPKTKPHGKGKVSRWKINTKSVPDRNTPHNKPKKDVAVDETSKSNRKQNRKRSTSGLTIHDSQEPSTSTGGCTTHRNVSETFNNKEFHQRKCNLQQVIDVDDDAPQTQEVLIASSPVITPEQDTGRSCILNFSEGFSESDMEKPRFSFTPAAAKVAYRLSEPDEKPVIEVPATINQYLRDYQREGIKFMYSHYKCGRGAILGDDMGLGKTVEVIGFLAALLHKKGNRIDVMRQKPKFIRKLSENADQLEDTETKKQFLIIGPGSVLYNWLDELVTWGYFVTSKYHGTNKESCLMDIKNKKVEIVVTTFETFRDHVEDLYSLDWDAVIVDEVHRIKEPKARTTQALRTLVTKKRFGLTGTLLQNNMTELWSILDWTQPGVLGSYDKFSTEFAYPIEKGQKHDASKRELAEARKKKEKFALIRSNLMIRRTKRLIADQLPGKEDNIVFCKLSSLQVSVYKAILGHPDMKIILKMNDPCDCESGSTRGRCCYRKGQNGSSPGALSLSFMHLLMKVANHVALLIPHSKMADNQIKRSKEICDIAFRDHPQFLGLTRNASFRTLSDPKYCGKMKVLQGLLSVFEKTHSKALIFSYSTKLLDILEQYVIASGHEYRRIDGSVNNRQRLDIVREFNKDPNIFICLISTKAGGLGLNLTGANRVVIFDPNWNPSHDLQAQDRAYRIGQRKNVQVFRLISVGTIEENVYLRQVYKQQLDSVAVATENAKRLFHGIQGDRMQTGELFGVKNMFKLRTGESCLTMDVLQRNAKIEAELGGYDIAKYIPVSSETGSEVSDEEEVSVDTTTDEESVLSTGSQFEDFFHSEDSGVDELHGETDCNKKPFKCSETVAKIKTRIKETSVERNKTARSKKTVTKLKKPRTIPELRARKRKSNVAAVAGDDEQDAVLVDQSPPHSFTSVNSVFEQCGVLHVHENKEMVGPSRAEEHMTRKAMQEVYELHQNSQQPAIQVDPYSESSEDEPDPPKVKKSRRQSTRLKKKYDHNTPQAIEYQSTRILVGQTPSAIRRQHFKKLGEYLKHESSLTLAEEVLSSNTKHNLETLRSFYLDQHPDLVDIITNVTTSEMEEKDEVRENVSSSRKRSKKDQPKSIVSTAKIKKSSKKKHVNRLTFTDVSDSESLKDVREQEMVTDQNPPSSLQIGMKSSHLIKTPRQNKQRRIVNTRLRKPLLTKKYAKCNLIEDKPKTCSVANKKVKNSSATSVRSCDNSSVAANDVFNIFDSVESSNTREEVDVDNLLGEMITDRELNKKGLCEKTHSVGNPGYSIIDNIFLNSPCIKKPPPTSSPKRKIYDASSKISEKLFSTSDENDSISDLLNISTLIDDNIDCFADSRKRHKTSVIKVGTHHHDSADDLDDLFNFSKTHTVHDSKVKEDESQSHGSESLFS